MSFFFLFFLLRFLPWACVLTGETQIYNSKFYILGSVKCFETLKTLLGA